MDNLRDIIAGLGYLPDSGWGWDNFGRTLEAYIGACNLGRVLEIGGGRSPLFSEEDVRRLGIEYTVNDIAQEELDLGPSHVSKVCFDISDRNLRVSDTYDLVFSRMVFEHLPDAGAAYRNLHRLLREDGLAVIFYPTLFSPPFVLNRILPEWVSSRLVGWLFRNRNHLQVPKLRAYYSRCYGKSSWMSRMLKEAGYSEWCIAPFYGHNYFEKVPVLRSIDRRLSQAAKAHGWQLLSSYAYCIARK